MTGDTAQMGKSAWATARTAKVMWVDLMITRNLVTTLTISCRITTVSLFAPCYVTYSESAE